MGIAASDPATDVAEAVVRDGHAWLRGSYDATTIDAIRAAVVARYDALARPPTYANPPLEPAEGVEIAKVGLVLHGIGAHCPTIADRMLSPRVLEAVRALLGPDARYEYGCAVLCDDPRPFFPWHMHVGGVDNVHYRKHRLFPTFDRVERITVLLYLDDLDSDSGELLVVPRVLGADTRAPDDPLVEAWRGAITLPCARGDVVLLDQCTWHAARPKRNRGVRAFLAWYFSRRDAAPTSWVDRSCESVFARDARLRALVAEPTIPTSPAEAWAPTTTRHSTSRDDAAGGDRCDPHLRRGSTDVGRHADVSRPGAPATRR
jgi:hypothetical protein